MNLISDIWMPFRKADGELESLSLHLISEGDFFDVGYERADFQGAAYQFLIGLLQTTFAPADMQIWKQYYDQPPTSEQLAEAFSKVKTAFELDGDGALFMQDFDSLDEAKPSPVSGLLIEAPGGNTLKQNTDHFIKRGIGEQMSLKTAAMALFTLQVNAPSGGQGHRTGLRGGGPLTTLIMPSESTASLWQKLWLNVMDQKSFAQHYAQGYAQAEGLLDSRVFPWLAPTKQSKQAGSEVYSEQVAALGMYWAMPRRIRLNVEQKSGDCALTGKASEIVVTQYQTQNYGYNYAGSWAHPLTPYRSNPKKPDDDKYSVKAQPGGLFYRHWHTLLFEDSIDGFHPATIVQYHERRAEALNMDEEKWRIWAFGYDLDNMKARGWYSAIFPVLHIDPDDRLEFLDEVKGLISVAMDYAKLLRKQLKQAWFGEGDAKGDFSQYEQNFWQATEADFYQLVFALAQAIKQEQEFSGDQAMTWLKKMQHTTRDLFDQWVLTADFEHTHLKRRIKAREQLNKWLNASKSVKVFKERYTEEA